MPVLSCQLFGVTCTLRIFLIWLMSCKCNRILILLDISLASLLNHILYGRGQYYEFMRSIRFESYSYTIFRRVRGCIGRPEKLGGQTGTACPPVLISLSRIANWWVISGEIQGAKSTARTQRARRAGWMQARLLVLIQETTRKAKGNISCWGSSHLNAPDRDQR